MILTAVTLTTMMMVSQNAHAVDDHVVDDGNVGGVVEADIEPTLKPTMERP